ncbi:MAG TPA: hypothetical protein VM144_13395 [Aestuariivirga sp.]|nr:hypothetical protein [Aestuariivirga sp.]
MAKTPKIPRKASEDYASGGNDFNQDFRNAASPQKNMIDDDMGKYGGVAPKRVPRTLKTSLDDGAGGGSPAVSTRKKILQKCADKGHDEFARKRWPIPGYIP